MYISEFVFIFSFKVHALVQQKTLISRSSRPNTLESKYQNFQITKFSLFKLIEKKVKKSASDGFCVCLTDIFHCLGNDTINSTHLLFTATAWVQSHSSASPLI